MFKSLTALLIGAAIVILASARGGPTAPTVRGDEKPKPPGNTRAVPPEEAGIRALEGWWDLSEAVTGALGSTKADRLYASLRIEFVPRYSDTDDRRLVESGEYLGDNIRKDAPKRGHVIVAIGRLWTIPTNDPKPDPLKRAFALTYRPGKTCLWFEEMFGGALEVPLNFTPGHTRNDDLLILQHTGTSWAFKRRT